MVDQIEKNLLKLGVKKNECDIVWNTDDKMYFVRLKGKDKLKNGKLLRKNKIAYKY